MATKSSTSARSTRQIESDLAATRSRLTSNIETFIDRVHPRRVKQRQTERLKQFVALKVDYAKSRINDVRRKLTGASGKLTDAGGRLRSQASGTLQGASGKLQTGGGKLHGVTAQLKDSQGRWRTDRLLPVGGAVGVVLLVFALIRLIAARGKNK
ncbi:MAG TPA: DUF3618 domain-containing protein [Propionibacteriaceae bacterium]|nr:DUF3618 domain-containing protein [Propionibacteriaceae bacterium]